MAGVPVILPDGTTGTLPEESVEATVREGGRVLSPQEHEAAVAKAQTDRAAEEAARSPAGIAKAYGEMSLAGMHANLRGEGEAVGLPLDKGIAGVADFVGGDSARKSTMSYLRELDARHPYLTAATGLAGNVAGAIGAGVATGAPGAIGAAPVAGARGVAARMAVGGVENVVQATTKDINEAALGDKKENAEALVANMPKHFVVGSLLTGAFEGGAHVLGKGFSAATSKAIPKLEMGASKGIGRELGLEGDEAVAAGARVRGLNDGAVPTKKGLADILTAEQGAQRAGFAAEAEGAADALAGAQTTEAALLSARHEAARKGAAEAGRRGVATAEGEAAEGAFEAAAKGGAGVEAAELGGAARIGEAKAAHAAAGEEALTAGERALAAGEAKETGVAAAMARAERKVAEVKDQFGAVHETLQGEHRAATESLRAISEEHRAATRDLQAAIERLGKEQGGRTPGVPRRVNGKATGAELQYAQRRPRPGDANLDTGEVWTKESIAEFDAERAAELAGNTGSKAAIDEISRLTGIQKSLAEAQKHAETHAGAVEDAIAKNAVEARRGVKAATVEAQREAAAVAPPLAATVENASKRSGHSMKALEAAEARVKQVEAETAAFIEKARGEGEHAVAKAEKRGAARIESAKADAAIARKDIETAAGKDKEALTKRHAAETKALPPAKTETDVDGFIKGMAERQAAMKGRPLVSGGAAWGAGMSMLHGNPVAAAGALGSSLAAGLARNHGNLAAARTMRGLSMALSSVDDAIRSGATSVLTGAASKTVRAATNEDVGSKKRAPKFDELSKGIVALQANPMELERRVRDSVGDIAGTAPGTYQEILVTTQRAHAFLLSILPPPQRDPNTLTPHLDPGNVSPTAQHEFMEASRTIDDPLSIFADVKDGSVTQTQVNAIQAVYPALFDKMRNEVRRQTMYLTTPVDYEREIHVGVLLGQITNEVLEPDFQRLMRDSYADKEKQGESPNAGGSGDMSKASKSMMSASQSIEGGSP